MKGSKEYTEIEKLKETFKHHSISIIKNKEKFRKDLYYVDVKVDDFDFKLLIDDEYGDFSDNNQLINWFLVLYALELYSDTEDILEWSKELNINVKIVLEHYKDLDEIYRKLTEIIGEIELPISSYDYTLRTGVVKALVKYRN